MKKLALIALIVFSLGQISAESSADKLISFHNIASKQKIEWNNFHKNSILQSKNLKNEITKDWVNFKNRNIKNLAQSSLTPESKEAYFKQKLDGAVALHKNHMNKWSVLMKKENETAYKLAAKHYNELARFEGKDFKSLSNRPAYSYSITKNENKSFIDKTKEFLSGKKALPAGQEAVTDEEIKELDVNTPQ